jgi:hydroxymethylglutaryl-CoA lyase
MDRPGSQDMIDRTPSSATTVRSADTTASEPAPTGLPMRVAWADLPPRVRVHEVGPRDGLQNEKAIVPTALKVEFVRRLAAAGLRDIEATSFVHPDWVPQLADSAQLLPQLPSDDGMRYSVLVPNKRGLDRLLDRIDADATPVREIAVFGSVTESFARRNLNRSVDESLDMFAPVVPAAHEAGLSVRGYLSMCFGDPWEGPVAIDRVVAISQRLLALGCDELALGDTIGTGTPGHVVALLGALTEAGVPIGRIAVHFHDTYGQALVNTMAALRCGVTVIDASAGGLGGCPYARSATGNLATEDLVWLLDGLGIDTGVDVRRLSETSHWLAQRLGRPSQSRVVRALTSPITSPGNTSEE